MASPSDLPRSLRRAAARPAGPRGRQPSPALLAAAAVGILTRANTSAGTAGRRAVDAATYQRRRAAEPGLTAREAAGHRVAGSRERTTTFLTSTPGPRRVTVAGPTLTLSDVRRGARYMGDLGALLADLSAASGNPARVAALKRQWERRMAARAPIAGLPFLADADAAIALADELRGDEHGALVFDSGRSRPGRRRRTSSAGRVRRPQTIARRRPGTGQRTGTRRGSTAATRQEQGQGFLDLIGEALDDAVEALGDGFDALDEGLDL